MHFFYFQHFRIEFHVNEQTTERHGTKIPKMWNNIQWNYYWKNERKMNVSSFSLSIMQSKSADTLYPSLSSKGKPALMVLLFRRVNVYCIWMCISTLMRAWFFTFETKSQCAPEIEAITVSFFWLSTVFFSSYRFLCQPNYVQLNFYIPWNAIIFPDIWFWCNSQSKFMHSN